MKQYITIQTTVLLFLFLILPVFAQSADITRIENFIQNITQLLVTLCGATATVFFVWGGFKYITSSGQNN
jgi:hypothetical protein